MDEITPMKSTISFPNSVGPLLNPLLAHFRSPSNLVPPRKHPINGSIASKKPTKPFFELSQKG